VDYGSRAGLQLRIRQRTLGKLEKLRAVASEELASISEYPRLDPKRVLRVYKKLGIRSTEALKEKLESGEIPAHGSAYSAGLDRDARNAAVSTAKEGCR
jgi:DNA polymerase/3'-5' exonuclease PolX